MPTDAPILHVGDKALIRGLSGIGRAKITRIDVCLRPSTDPAGEQHFARVDAIELGEHGPPFVVSVEGGAWAYGAAIVPEDIEKGDEHES